MSITLEIIGEKIVSRLVSANIIEDKERKIYMYGLQLLATKITAFLCALMISAFMGTIPVLVFIVVFFAPLRRYGGGVHASRISTCLVVSELLLVLCQIIYVCDIGIIVEIICVLCGMFFVFTLAPQETPNKPLTTDQRVKYRKIVLLAALAEVVIFFTAAYFAVPIITFSISAAFMLQSILLVCGCKGNISKK